VLWTSTEQRRANIALLKTRNQLIDKGFLFLYKRDKSALENYQSRPSLQAFFNPYLEKHDPARFEAIRQHCAARIAAVDAQIAALCD
jgi:hypothetical protein